MTATTTDRPAPTAPAPAGRDGFPQLLRAEWTKLRTVRGWVAGLVIAVLVTLSLGLLAAADSQLSCGGDSIGGPGGVDPCNPRPPAIGPGGEAVRDDPYVVEQPLTGNGSITARVTSLVGRTPGQTEAEPWAKAGLIVKASTTPGATYAAVMVTADHGVRMQHDFTHDVAGSPGVVTASSPRWLRLTRSGDRVTGYESTDGTNWRRVGETELSGLGTSASVGMFVASPDHEETSQTFGGSSSSGGPSLAAGTFDTVALADGWQAAAAWTGVDIGNTTDRESDEGFRQSGESFTITATGDAAPLLAGPGGGLDRDLTGLIAGLIAVIVVGTMFVTAEYRRGLIRTTFTASPRRGRVLVAKALVIGAAAFVAGLVAVVLSLWLVGDLRRDRGLGSLPVPLLTEARVAVATAGLIALTAVLALAVGAILRRSAGAVMVAIALVVLPYIVAAAFILPQAPAEWVMRVTPAAAFAVQQSFPEYEHVTGSYLMSDGYYPIQPLAGLAVLGVWTAAALALATWVVNRRDV